MNFVPVHKVLSDIDNSTLVLPPFQRSFVWKRPDIRDFIDSVYNSYPVGSLATWQTNRPINPSESGENDRSDPINYILDGQQRITSLYGVIRGKLPPFHTSKENPTAGLMFHVRDKKFAFERTAEVRKKADGLWVKVTGLFQEGGVAAERNNLEDRIGGKRVDLYDYSDAMNRLVTRLREVELPVLELSDETLTVEDVVNIFNKMNKGGKKLTPYELSFALLSVGWPDVRADFQDVADRWQGRIDMDIDLLLRVVNAVATSSGKLGIEKEKISDLQRILKQTSDAVDHVLNLLADRLGLDHPRVLKQRLPLAVMAKFVVKSGGRITNTQERDKLLYWYILSAVFGTYLRAPESRLTRDLTVINKADSTELDSLIANLKLDRPDLKIAASDMDGTLSSSTFFTVLYMLSRVHGAKDWETGETLRQGMLGQNSKLEIHHIFPKSLLSRAGIPGKQINNLANLAFQTSGTNKAISSSNPADYLAAVAEKHQGALESQWVPMEQSHWQLSNYEAFLRGRQANLAQAANDFLDQLQSGNLPDIATGGTRSVEIVGVDTDDDEHAARLIADFMENAPGMIGHPIDVPGGNPIYLDVAWPQGLQFGMSEPVAFLFDADADIIQRATLAGFKVFTDESQLRQYVRQLSSDEGN